MDTKDIKTGEVNDIDEDGNLYLCESFETKTGEVYTTRTLIEDMYYHKLYEAQA